MIENGNAELLRLIGKVAGDAGAGEDDDANWHDVEDVHNSYDSLKLGAKGSAFPKI